MRLSTSTLFCFLAYFSWSSVHGGADGTVERPDHPKLVDPPSSLRKIAFQIETVEFTSQELEALIETVLMPFNAERVYSSGDSIHFGDGRVSGDSVIKSDQTSGFRVGILTSAQRRILIGRHFKQFHARVRQAKRVVSGIGDSTRLQTGDGSVFNLRQRVSADHFKIALRIFLESDRTGNSGAGRNKPDTALSLDFELWDGQTVILSPPDETRASRAEAGSEQKRLILISATIVDANGHQIRRHEN